MLQFDVTFINYCCISVTSHGYWRGAIIKGERFTFCYKLFFYDQNLFHLSQ